MKTNSREWETRFDSKIPKEDDRLFSANCVSDTYEFGYKHMSDDTTHTVTDWGNIKNFFHQELQKAREKIINALCPDGLTYEQITALSELDQHTDGMPHPFGNPEGVYPTNITSE